MEGLLGLVLNPWYLFVTALVSGIAIGMWISETLARRERQKLDKP